MNMNTQQARVVDPVLTNHAQGYKHADHVGHVLFPRVPVKTRGGKVLKFGKEGFYLYNARRAPGANTGRINFGYEGEPYALEQDSLEVPIPREHQEDAQQAVGIDLSLRGTSLVKRTLRTQFRWHPFFVKQKNAGDETHGTHSYIARSTSLNTTDCWKSMVIFCLTSCHHKNATTNYWKPFLTSFLFVCNN